MSGLRKTNSGLRGEPDLVDELGRHQIGDSWLDTQRIHQVERRTANRSPPRRSAYVSPSGPADRCGRRSSSATSRAHSPRRRLRWTHMLRTVRSAHRVRQVRARSLRRRTGYRPPCRRSYWASSPIDGSGPSNPVISAAASESRSGARAMVCAPGTRAQRTLILGSVGDQHQQGRLRNHREEVGQHRLADLVDPMRILDDIDGWRTRGTMTRP